MFVSLIDRILGVEPLKEVRAVKSLSFRENYFRDHFPGFPIMPGALQVEAMIQAAQWLLRKSFDFPRVDFSACSISNARYTKYVRPGDQLNLKVVLTKNEDPVFSFRGSCEVCGVRTAAVQFDLVTYEALWQGGLSEERAAELIRQQRDAYQRLSRERAPAYELAQVRGASTSRTSLSSAVGIDHGGRA